MSAKSGLSKKLLESLFWYKANGVGLQAVSDKLREQYSAELDRIKCTYYVKCSDTQTTLHRSDPGVTKSSLELFPPIKCPAPSGSYLTVMFVRAALLRRAHMERQIISVTGDALCHDETFKEAKRIVVQGSQPYISLYVSSYPQPESHARAYVLP